MKLKSLNLKDIKICDEFWSRHVDLVRNVIIPYQWEIMNDRVEDAESSHCLENFKIAAGKSSGDFYGAVFQDTDIAKWLEAVGFSLACNPDPKLEATADEVIDLIADAQCKDGYINTYFTIKEPDKRWSNLCEGHELYTAGHLMEAAAAYYEGTGKKKFLDCMCRFADLICKTFGEEEGKIHGYPGHQEVEIGLIKLYRITKERRYLDMAKYFIDTRGVGDNYFLKEMEKEGHKRIFPEFADYDTKYSQSHLPVREQRTAEGHAVRAVYMYCAMADLAYEYQDASLMNACETLWNNMVSKRMYITGGIGSSGILERFTTDYDLPNEYNYSESCASIGLALFGLRMNQITRDGKYMEEVERALYNTVLAGIALDGRSFFYVNPLEVWPDACMPRTSKEHVKPVRQKWFGVACCPPNIARTLASLGQYIYSTQGDSVWVNLFVTSEVQQELESGSILMKQETRFPNEGKTTIRIENREKVKVSLAVRVPEYAKDAVFYSNSKKIMPVKMEKGYAFFTVDREELELTMEFSMEPRILHANPLVKADTGKAAVMKGPCVYCLEETDNGNNLPGLFLETGAPLREHFEPDLLGGVTVIEAKGKRLISDEWKEGELYKECAPKMEDAALTFVPYAYWGNRVTGEMLVWVRESL
ncbi:glycoside hydrolase family 127 protein [Robinsoniella peoriensis]|uniref:glycoside hydrolase family 127 protein n=1 Tax=Robinsoniella peoriensis TaxID=180332 RepID=UPI00085C5D9C|nr:beta-L-arabinofuranosidase domain-containing protein [Robinsoniella peoriensis]